MTGMILGIVALLVVQARPAAGGAQDQALAAAITRQLTRLEGGVPQRGEVVMSDLDGDANPEAVVGYCVMGPSSGGCGFFVMVRRGPQWVSTGPVMLGQGKLQGVKGRVIEGESLTLGPNDARCCPTVKAVRRFELREGRVVEVVPPPFLVEIRQVRTSNRDGYRQVTVWLRFLNPNDKPVTLVSDPAGRLLVDDRGNRYQATADRPLGMATIRETTTAPPFTIAPGRYADALMHFAWGQRQLFGLEYTLDLVVQEISRVPAGWLPGATHPLRWTNLKDGATALVPGASQLSTDACAGRLDCSAADGLVAELARVSSTLNGGVPYTRLGVRFRNPGSTPLMLCYASRSASAADDRGNPYALFPEAQAVRGIPVCGRPLDPGFMIAPGASREATVEFQYRGSYETVRGTAADFAFAVQEIERVSADQLTLRREIPVILRSIPLAPGAAAAAPASSDGGAPSAPAEAAGDPCTGIPLCYAAGPFTAQLTSVVPSREAGYRYLRLGVRVKNLGQEPLILCFVSTSGVANDERQNRYAIREDIGVKGFGLCTPQRANPQFVIQPGRTRDGSLEFNVGIYDPQTIFGETFAITFALEQLAILPGNQLQKTGEFVVNFEGVTKR